MKQGIIRDGSRSILRFFPVLNISVWNGAQSFLNDHSGQFAWIPFECKESFSCVLCTHKADSRKGLSAFINVLKKLYQDAVAFPL